MALTLGIDRTMSTMPDSFFVYWISWDGTGAVPYKGSDVKTTPCGCPSGRTRGFIRDGTLRLRSGQALAVPYKG